MFPLSWGAKPIAARWILPTSSIAFGWALPYLTWIDTEVTEFNVYLNKVLYKCTGWFLQIHSEFTTPDASTIFDLKIILVLYPKHVSTCWLENTLVKNFSGYWITGHARHAENSPSCLICSLVLGKINPFFHPATMETRSGGVINQSGNTTLRSQVSADGLGLSNISKEIRSPIPPEI